MRGSIKSDEMHDNNILCSLFAETEYCNLIHVITIAVLLIIIDAYVYTN